MGCHFLLQGIFPTRESSPGLLHCRQILYQLTYKASPFYNPIKQALLDYNIYLLSMSTSLQLLSHVRLFVTPWTEALQASLSITNSWSLLKLMSMESVMPSNHLILSHPLLLSSIFPCIRVFSKGLALCISGQNIGASYWAAKWLSYSLDVLCKRISHAVQG